eukprot:g1025.t1
MKGLPTIVPAKASSRTTRNMDWQTMKDQMVQLKEKTKDFRSKVRKMTSKSFLAAKRNKREMVKRMESREAPRRREKKTIIIEQLHPKIDTTLERRAKEIVANMKAQSDRSDKIVRRVKKYVECARIRAKTTLGYGDETADSVAVMKKMDLVPYFTEAKRLGANKYFAPTNLSELSEPVYAMDDVDEHFYEDVRRAQRASDEKKQSEGRRRRREKRGCDGEEADGIINHALDSSASKAAERSAIEKESEDATRKARMMLRMEELRDALAAGAMTDEDFQRAQMRTIKIFSTPRIDQHRVTTDGVTSYASLAELNRSYAADQKEKRRQENAARRLGESKKTKRTPALPPRSPNFAKHFDNVRTRLGKTNDRLSRISSGADEWSALETIVRETATVAKQRHLFADSEETRDYFAKLLHQRRAIFFSAVHIVAILRLHCSQIFEVAITTAVDSEEDDITQIPRFSVLALGDSVLLSVSLALLLSHGNVRATCYTYVCTDASYVVGQCMRQRTRVLALKRRMADVRQKIARENAQRLRREDSEREICARRSNSGRVYSGKLKKRSGKLGESEGVARNATSAKKRYDASGGDDSARFNSWKIFMSVEGYGWKRASPFSRCIFICQWDLANADCARIVKQSRDAKLGAFVVVLDRSRDETETETETEEEESPTPTGLAKLLADEKSLFSVRKRGHCGEVTKKMRYWIFERIETRTLTTPRQRTIQGKELWETRVGGRDCPTFAPARSYGS